MAPCLFMKGFRFMKVREISGEVPRFQRIRDIFDRQGTYRMLDILPTSLGERLPFADGDRILERDVRPPSSFEPFLLAGDGICAPFARLHLLHAATKFCRLVDPPLDHG